MKKKKDGKDSIASMVHAKGNNGMASRTVSYNRRAVLKPFHHRTTQIATDC